MAANTINFQNQAYDTIKEMILKTELIPGEKISEKELEEKLTIGRSPVRVAIIRLQKEGLFHVVPQSGTYVSKINLQQVNEAKFVRETIEKLIFVEARELITEKDLAELDKIIKLQKVYAEAEDHSNFLLYDEAFHEFFYTIANKKNVWDWMQILNLQLNRFRMLSLDVNWAKIICQHEEIVQAVKAKDNKQIETLISKHLHLVDENTERLLKAYPNYFL
jgi:GntR family transcriptional regulator, rspAB operon transcriptional repressor